jgi:hypothetical protein
VPLSVLLGRLCRPPQAQPTHHALSIAFNDTRTPTAPALRYPASRSPPAGARPFVHARRLSNSSSPTIPVHGSDHSWGDTPPERARRIALPVEKAGTAPADRHSLGSLGEEEREREGGGERESNGRGGGGGGRGDGDGFLLVVHGRAARVAPPGDPFQVPADQGALRPGSVGLPQGEATCSFALVRICSFVPPSCVFVSGAMPMEPAGIPGDSPYFGGCGEVL